MWSTSLPPVDPRLLEDSPPCLRNLVIQDTPLCEVEPLRGAPRRPAFWILAGVVVLLLMVGLAASILAKPEAPRRAPGVSVGQEAARPTAVTTTAEGPNHPFEGPNHPSKGQDHGAALVPGTGPVEIPARSGALPGAPPL